MSADKDIGTIKCKVVADKVWYSKESRFLAQGEEVDFPAKVKNHKGEMVDFKVGDSFELVEPVKAKAEGKKPAGDKKTDGDKPAGDKKTDGDKPPADDLV